MARAPRRPSLAASTGTLTRRSTSDRLALLPVVRGLKLLQRHNPKVFVHIARNVGFMLEGNPKERAEYLRNPKRAEQVKLADYILATYQYQ